MHLQGRSGGGEAGHLVIEVERRVQEFKRWEIRTLQMCVSYTTGR